MFNGAKRSDPVTVRDELTSAGLSGQQLAQLAGACGAESGKLSELALIFQGY